MATLPTEAGGAGMAGGPAQVPPTSGSAENSSTTTGGQMAGPVLGPVSTPMDDGMAAPMDDGMAAPMNGGMATPMNGGMATPMDDGMAAPMDDGMAAPMDDGMAVPKLKPVMSVSEDGPYEPMREEGVNGGAAWLFRPTTLGADGEKHPVLVWGCGAGSTPRNYVDHMGRISSHGFVVYAVDSSSVNARLLTEGLDWVFAENERSGSDLMGKLDLENVAVGGHSLGSLSTYDMADDPRIANTIHVDGGTFDATGGAKLMKPAIFICGEDSTGAPNCEQDYEDANVPIFYTRIMGLSGLQGHVQAAREGLDVWVAWMRWQMIPEEDRSSDFLDPMCTFCTGKWISKTKGF